jgi:phosphatidylinositol alpha-1,6-mannosyltransferase
MKRALYLTPGVFDKGGISRYGRYQIRALREILGAEGVEVISLAPPLAGDLEEPFAVDFASFGATLRGRALFAAAAAAAALGDRPAIVWCAHLYMAPLALPIARAARAKLVLDVYGTEVWTGRTRVRAAALRRADWVVSDCHNTARYLAEHGLRGPERTVVHWDCVDLARFSPGDAGDVLARYGVPDVPAVTVLTLGRMSPDTEYKGYDRLLEVLARIPADSGVRVVLAGDGARRAVLAARARELGLEGRAYFIGSVHERDMPALYRACDLFSLVTHTGPGSGEGVPLTPLEAAACGKPILVGDQDGSHEAVEDGVSGFVVHTFDLDAQRDRILRLARDPALRARMGAAARARIEREHAYERFRDRIATLLDELGVRR